ncbi:hypothetical protein NDU88_006157 [Pleurodeles waltl]|uniref:Uncharacterized protein n=1 Tax=Pleurodeles waltl TaxID=8319 RepID=A0AAV7VM24_PLEWA|nr:hypothetical protein NDU88_006157 [Pleurodeles waltl]
MAERLLKVYTETFGKDKLPVSMREAIVVVVVFSKPNRDVEAVDSHHHISMLNVGYMMVVPEGLMFAEWKRDMAEWENAEEYHMRKTRRDDKLPDESRAWAAMLTELLNPLDAQLP